MKKEAKLTKLEMGNELYESIKSITDKDGTLFVSFDRVLGGVEGSLNHTPPSISTDNLESDITQWFHGIWGDEPIFLTSSDTYMKFYSDDQKLYASATSDQDPEGIGELEWDTQSLMEIIGVCAGTDNIFLDEENDEYKWHISFTIKGSENSDIPNLVVLNQTKNRELSKKIKTKIAGEIKEEVHGWITRKLNSLNHDGLSSYPTYSLEFDSNDTSYGNGYTADISLSQDFEIVPREGKMER